MPIHRDMTGADLHEPKGVESASANTIYIADGAGSGLWTKVPSSGLDTSSVHNLNREQLAVLFTDIGTSGSQYLGLAKACTVVKIVVALQGSTATASTVLTFRNDAGTSMGTVSIPSGSTAGTVFTISPVSNNIFSANTKLQIDTDGGTSTTPNVTVTFELVWT